MSRRSATAERRLVEMVLERLAGTGGGDKIPVFTR